MASTYLTRSVSTTGNRRTWTFSAWVKRSNITQQYQNMFAAGSNNIRINFSNQNIWVYDYNGSSFDFYLVTNRLFRDTSAWYHIVAIWDSTQATSSDRMKLYVNGVQETSLSASVYPTQNYDSYVNQSGELNQIGTYAPASAPSFDGSMSHFHLIDGTAYAPTAFGSTDSTTGEWKINTSPSVTYGTNGFFILKDGNSVTDQSGNGNNFTVAGGTLTNTEDNPSNVFATLNPLVGASSSVTYSQGNLTAAIASSKSTASTLGAGTGKFYFETKINNTANTYIGICSDRNTGTDFGSYRPLTESALVNNSGTIYNAGGSSGAKGLTGLADNDIIGCAFDVDNGKVWWSRNGQWYSGDANPTSTINISDVVAGNNAHSFSSWTGQFILGAFGTSTNANNISVNFGNGYFGTTAVSSAGTNASGNGIFEYDVPTGYTSLSTKGLNL